MLHGMFFGYVCSVLAFPINSFSESFADFCTMFVSIFYIFFDTKDELSEETRAKIEMMQTDFK